MEKCIELEDFSGYSSGDITEGYFEVDEYSEMLKKKIARYESLADKSELTEEERAERAKLRCELSLCSGGLSAQAKQAFEEIERRRKVNG